VREDQFEDWDLSASLVEALMGNIDKVLAIKNCEKSLHAAVPSSARDILGGR
jgi:hypothetical protein